MKVFDMGKNVGLDSSWKTVIVGKGMMDDIVKEIEAANAGKVSFVGELFGIKVLEESDFRTRKGMALVEAYEGRCCCYEGEDGELIVISPRLLLGDKP